MKENTGQVLVQSPPEVANYLLNEKRRPLSEIEQRHEASVVIVADPNLETPHYEVRRIRESELPEHARPSYERVTPSRPWPHRRRRRPVAASRPRSRGSRRRRRPRSVTTPRRRRRRRLPHRSSPRRRQRRRHARLPCRRPRRARACGSASSLSSPARPRPNRRRGPPAAIPTRAGANARIADRAIAATSAAPVTTVAAAPARAARATSARAAARRAVPTRGP